MTGKLITQAEAAVRLRMTEEAVKRLRLTGRLPYYPGRPVLLAEQDVEAYLAKRARLISEREAADILGCKIAHVQRLCQEGKLQAERSRALRLDIEEVTALAAEREKMRIAEAEATRASEIHRRAQLAWLRMRRKPRR